MTGSAKRRGDRAELEVQGLLRDLLGVPARRALGAGRRDDMGDITGVPGTTIQVVDWKDVTRAVREKPLECEEQRLRRWQSTSVPGVTAEGAFAATFVRLRGGTYRVVMTPEQFAALWREAA